MRFSSFDVDWILDSENLVGINLGWDFVAEHEWGIKSIRKAFGIPDPNVTEPSGLKSRTIRKIPRDHLALVEENSRHIFLYHPMVDLRDPDSLDHLTSKLSTRDTELSAAWSDKDFGFSCPLNERTNGYVKALWEAFLAKDIAIFILGRSGPFGNGGLAILIPSKVPTAIKESMKTADLDNTRLYKAAKKTKIQKALEKARCRYYALKPRWATSEEAKETNFDVVFFLNPQEQDRNNFGWFTVEELKAWAVGEGPIPKLERVNETRDPRISS